MVGIFTMIVSLIGYALFAFLVVIIGTKVMPEPSTKADFQEGFRVLGFSASPGVFNVLAIIPFLGPLISFLIAIWMLVIGVIATREVLDYSNTGRAVIVCIIAWIIYLDRHRRDPDAAARRRRYCEERLIGRRSGPDFLGRLLMLSTVRASIRATTPAQKSPFDHVYTRYG